MTVFIYLPLRTNYCRYPGLPVYPAHPAPHTNGAMASGHRPNFLHSALLLGSCTTTLIAVRHSQETRIIGSQDGGQSEEFLSNRIVALQCCDLGRRIGVEQGCGIVDSRLHMAGYRCAVQAVQYRGDVLMRQLVISIAGRRSAQYLDVIFPA